MLDFFPHHFPQIIIMQVGVDMESTARDGARHFSEATLMEKLAYSCILTFPLLFTS